MTEDVSAYIRTSVTMNLLAGLIAAVLVMTVTAMSWLSSFQTKYIQSINNSQVSVGAELKNEQRISAAVAYKFISNREDAIEEITIVYKSGITTADYKTLLQNADKYVKLSYIDGGNGTIKVTLEEVD